MIAVTGASGKLGRHVMAGLLEKVPSEQLVALVRDPGKVADLADKGVKVRVADYSRPETLGTALQGVEKLLLISSNEMGQRFEQHKAVIDAGKEAGVKLIAYTSVLRADKSSLMVAPEHVATEEYLVGSGVPWVFLRNGWYIENYTENMAGSIAHGMFPGAAKDGRIAAASRADFAAAAVTVLTTSGHENKVYELAGDVSFTMTDLAASVSNWADKTLPYKDMSFEEYRAVLLGAGLPEMFAEFYAHTDVCITKGELDSNSRDLHDLIGHDTQTLNEVLAQMPKPIELHT